MKTPKELKDLEDWSDKKVLKAVYFLLQRANVSTKFIATDEGLYTGHAVVVSCGDKFFQSRPMPLDWPLQPVGIPDEFKEKLN